MNKKIIITLFLFNFNLSASLEDIKYLGGKNFFKQFAEENTDTGRSQVIYSAIGDISLMLLNANTYDEARNIIKDLFSFIEKNKRLLSESTLISILKDLKNLDSKQKSEIEEAVEKTEDSLDDLINELLVPQ